MVISKTKQETSTMTSEEMTLEELADELELLYWEQGIESCRIIECSKSQLSNIYTVNHLTMDIENEFVMMSDDNGVIENNKSILMLFVKDCVMSIHKIFTKQGKAYDELEFVDRKVIIEVM